MGLSVLDTSIRRATPKYSESGPSRLSLFTVATYGEERASQLDAVASLALILPHAKRITIIGCPTPPRDFDFAM